jgi:hypothetical protein
MRVDRDLGHSLSALGGGRSRLRCVTLIEELFDRPGDRRRTEPETAGNMGAIRRTVLFQIVEDHRDVDLVLEVGVGGAADRDGVHGKISSPNRSGWWKSSRSPTGDHAPQCGWVEFSEHL